MGEEDDYGSKGTTSVLDFPTQHASWLFCATLAEALLTELDGLAEQANRQNAGTAALGDKALIER